MLAKVLDAASDILAKENKTESHSTQDMLATIEERINNNANIEDLVFFSTDVKSLYPRLQAEPCAAIIARMMEESSLEVEGVNWDQKRISHRFSIMLVPDFVILHPNLRVQQGHSVVVIV